MVDSRPDLENESHEDGINAACSSRDKPDLKSCATQTDFSITGGPLQ